VRGPGAPRTRRALLLLVAAWAASAACAHKPGATGHTKQGVWAVGPDPVTIGLWHMDETIGMGVTEAGPFRLGGTAGVDTRTGYGRLGRAREFTRSVNSFVFVPYDPVFESGAALTVEAWIDPLDYGYFEDTPIAARWTPEAFQSSWLLSLVGRNHPPADQISPAEHAGLVRPGIGAGRVMFAFQPVEAGSPRSFFSSRAVDRERWTHVAATYDGQIVRIYLNGQLDSQYASLGQIRPSEAPLVVGNSIDPRTLTRFSGDLRVGSNTDPTAYYAFVGLIDELRISNRARPEFPYARGP